MAYNLLFDTEFKSKDNYWNFINCKYRDGCLISKDKIFGIEQEIVLADITKLYFRFNYKVLSSSINKIYAGIQVGDKLYVTKKWAKYDVEQLISVVENAEEEKIKVHIIFECERESETLEERVKIEKPMLADLKRLHKTTWLKFLLDKTVKYVPGYLYKNLLHYSEIKPRIYNLEQAKVGSIISTQEQLKLRINAKLYKGKRYLLKLDYIPINELGKLFLNYGVMKSTTYNKEQEYLLFRCTGDYELAINIEPNDVLPYQLNLKHLMLIETEGVGIELKDIPYLPFI